MELNSLADGGTTLTEVLNGLASEGYDGSFVADDDGVVACRTCGHEVEPHRVQVEGIRRIEGASDPGDLAAVLAVRCFACGAGGALVARYGPEATLADEALLSATEFQHDDSFDAAERASQHEADPPAPSQPAGAAS